MVRFLEPPLRKADGATRTSRDESANALITVPGSRLSSPSSVHNACRRVRTSGAFSASLRSVATTDLSPRSMSIRCAVSLHQPFGCDSRAASCAADSFARMGLGPRARRVVHDAKDAAFVHRRLQLALRDVVAEVVGHVGHVLDDAVVHVDDVEGAVGSRRQKYGAEALVVEARNRLLVGLTPPERAPSSVTTMRLTRLPAGSATKTLPWRSAGSRSPR